jgi:hypothetical protein
MPMSSPDRLALDAPQAEADADADEQVLPGFRSVLFDPTQQNAERGRDEPDFFADLNLDQVLSTLVAGREEYDLAPFFYEPLHDPASVNYRHEVLRDLERDEVAQTVGRSRVRWPRCASSSRSLKSSGTSGRRSAGSCQPSTRTATRSSC